MKNRRQLPIGIFLFILAAASIRAFAQTTPPQPVIPQLVIPQPVIIDTDIGDDVDDAFAVGLALSSPELKILGITSAWGDTKLRARLLDRLLCETGRTDIPVAVGIEKHGPGQATFSQARWAERQPDRPHTPAVDFLLNQIKQHPGEITLIGIAPLTNLGAALERDPATFKKLKRIVIMGGSIRRGYGDVGYAPDHGPDAEYNIAMDPPAAKAVFNSGVPLYVMPLDSTQIPLDEEKRGLLFTRGTNLTDALTLLYEQWSRERQLRRARAQPQLEARPHRALAARHRLLQAAHAPVHLEELPRRRRSLLDTVTSEFIWKHQSTLLRPRPSGSTTSSPAKSSSPSSSTSAPFASTSPKSSGSPATPSTEPKASSSRHFFEWLEKDFRLSDYELTICDGQFCLQFDGPWTDHHVGALRPLHPRRTAKPAPLSKA
jgi:purine nucleosidase